MDVSPLCLLVIAVALGADGNSREYNNHLKRVWEFGCKEPQKRAISVGSLKTLPADETYFPEVTVLHRCDKFAGRCPQGEGFCCSPAAAEDVQLVFRVTRVPVAPKSRAHRRESNVRYETITVSNHTACECQPQTDLPK